jgi:hypothetical protein
MTAPAGTSTNDLVMIFCAVASYGSSGFTWSCPGFTAVSGVGASGNGCQQLLYKIAGGAEPGTYTVTMSGSYVWAAVIAGYYQVNTGLVLDPLPGSSGAVNAAAQVITAPGITTTQGGDKLAWFGWIAGTLAPAITVPSGFAAEVSQSSTTSVSLTNIGVIMGDASQTSAGTTGSEIGTVAVMAEDTSTPAPLHRPNSTTGTATTATFSPPANSMVVVCTAAMYLNQSSATSLSCADSLSNAYTAGPSAGGTGNAYSQIFTRYYSSAPGSITVTVSNTNHNAAAMYLAARVVTGASFAQAGAASVSTNQLNAPIVTTANGSLVYVMAAEPVTSSLTVEPLGSTLDFWLDTISGDGAYLQKQSSPTGIPGSTLLGYTPSGGGNGTVMLEILPAAPGGINGGMLVAIPLFTGPAIDYSPYVISSASGYY